jgi:hypothetical protein
MRCPDPIAEALAGILQLGIMQARSAAWAGENDLCAALTDHIHNLPDLLADFSDDRLAFYWQTERPTFISCVDDDISKPYTDIWSELETHIRLTESATAND